MKTPVSICLFLAFLCLFVPTAEGQRRAVRKKTSSAAAAAKAPEIGRTAVVFDENLSVLRQSPSLYALAVQRMRLGRKVKILETVENDGVTFFKIEALPQDYGWIQSDALLGKFRKGDEERLARLVYASKAFAQIELASAFLELYPRSAYRSAMLLLYGDLIEAAAIKLSRDAVKRITPREMAATGAPEHSYFLNFVSLDRYRRLGIVFLFNPLTKRYHYNGASWTEIMKDFPDTLDAKNAEVRLAALKEKMAKTAEVK
jgi:hypothetical protein